MSDILHREAYAGRREYSGVEVAFPPIVDPATWEKAQAAIRQRRSEPTGQTRHIYTLQSLVSCSECGRRFIARTKNGVSPSPIRYYLCGGKGDDGEKCRKTRHIRADRLERLVWDLLADFLLNPDAMRAVVETATAPDVLNRTSGRLSGTLPV